ncbi:MAG: 2-oxoacid:acceptor oxidoreductase subunit alpha, partial [Planctomycetes bacterium]|nr:2-oxoacid:acceptor oxidoreductase subunit alpha [Planctomycetota bacterium]
VLGLVAGWFGLGRKSLLDGLRKRFAKKSAEVLEAGEKAYNSGIEFAAAHPLKTQVEIVPPPHAGKGLYITDGNNMCAIAALHAGCRFFGGYPITPSTEIMQTLSRELPKYGGTVLQCEDEIAGIGAALGASFGGVKSMTATSGPGMSLKTEILGLATIAELPLVVVNVQRGGPSTGIPTKSEQSDLFQAAFSAHGDVLRPVLAPISVADTFPITVEAFNMAEEYQTPVVLLSDQDLSQRKETVAPFDPLACKVVERRAPTPEELKSGYKRFALTEDGISPLSHPGMEGGIYLGAGIEHNETGAPTSNGDMHIRMNDKRFRKFAPLMKREDLVIEEGDPQAELALVAWGSTASICLETLDLAREENLRVKLLIPKLVFPVLEQVYEKFFSGVRAGFVVELSHQGQLYRILRAYTDVPKGMSSFCRSGANPFRPQELLESLRALAK